MDLTRCPQCATDFVNPVEWESHDDEHMWIQLRCGSCEAFSEVVVPNRLAELFDADLARGMAVIDAAVEELERQRMIDMVETFVAALQRDLIEPADFR